MDEVTGDEVTGDEIFADEVLLGTDVSIEDKSQAEKVLTIKVRRQLYDGKYNALLSQKVRQSHLKGFRPGRAPKAVVEKMYREQLDSQVLGELIAPIIQRIIDKQGWKVIGNPVIVDDLKVEDEHVGVSILVYLYPEPKIEHWEGIELDVDVEEYHPEDVEHQLLHMREKMGQFVEIPDRTEVQKGDFVDMLFTLTVDGEVKQETKEGPWMLEISMNPSDPDDISPHFVGRKVGDKFSFVHKFSDIFDKDIELRGKEGTFDVTIQSIKKLELAELDEEFLKKIDFKGTIEELRNYMAEQEQHRVKEANQQAFEATFFAKILELNPFDVSEPLIEHQTKSILQDIGVGKDGEPISEEMFKKYVNYFRAGATYRAKCRIVIDRLLAQNSWHVSDEEYESHLMLDAKRLGVPPDDYRKFLVENKYDDISRYHASTQHAMKRLREKIVVREKVLPRQQCSRHHV